MINPEALKAKSRKYRIVWLILYITALVCCVTPELVGAIVLSHGKEGKTFLALSGFSVTILAVMLLIVFRNVVKKYSAKVPITIKTLVAFTVLVLLLNALQKCIDEAVYIAFLGFIGAVVGTIIEIFAIYFKNAASDLKAQYDLMISGTAKPADEGTAEKESS